MFETTIKKFLKREIKQFDESQDETNNALNYFRRSRIHWLYLLNILFAYYEKKIITKSDLIHKIQVSHITILKYRNEIILNRNFKKINNFLKVVIRYMSPNDNKTIKKFFYYVPNFYGLGLYFTQCKCIKIS